MERTLIKFLSGVINQITSTNFKIILFNNGDVIKGSNIFYFWKYVEKYNSGELALSVDEAIKKNLSTYLTKRSCRKGHDPVRNLNDECVQCVQRATQTKPLDGRASPATVMMRNHPDMIISYDDAVAVGFNVYRTGVPCCHGHTDYRYVNNKTCVACSRNY